MKGDLDVISDLEQYLRIELTGHKQYLLNAKQNGRWGYDDLARKQLDYSEEETRHAGRLLERILFLEGAPDLRDHREIRPAANVQEQLQRDLDLVMTAIDHLRGAAARSLAKGDQASRELFVEMLEDEERHVDWLETQLRLIRQLGETAYLQEKT